MFDMLKRLDCFLLPIMYKRKKSPRKSSKRGKKAGFIRSLQALIIKRIKLLGFSLALVLGTFLVASGVYLFNYFRINLTQASSGTFMGAGNLDVSHNFNLIAFNIDSFSDPTSSISSLGILSFQVDKSKLTVLQIPIDDYVNNFYGSGKISISSLYGLSSLSTSKGKSGFSMEKVLSLQLGLPIDGVVYTDEAGANKISQTLGINSEYFTKSRNFFGNSVATLRLLTVLGSSFKTNLDLRSILALSNYLALRFPQDMEFVTLNKISENAGKYDLLFKDKIAPQNILEERQSLIVLNATNVPGLALAMGRLGSNLGLSLLSTGNTSFPEQFSGSVLITRNPHSYAASRLVQVFNIEDVRSADSVADDPKFSRLMRADMLLIAGADQLQN